MNSEVMDEVMNQHVRVDPVDEILNLASMQTFSTMVSPFKLLSYTSLLTNDKEYLAGKYKEALDFAMNLYNSQQQSQ